MTKKAAKMYVGIDMGTNSVGMAITDEHYNLYRAKGKDYWCSRLFERAETAEERRMNRIARRRHQREVARMGILRELFSDEINKIDPGFYARLDESKYYLEDREGDQPFALFADTGYTDKEYYDQYPTIFHLRKELIESGETHDVRLVYLAIANMFKHRGNFLSDSLSIDQSAMSMEEAYQAFREVAAAYEIESFPEQIDAEKLEGVLGQRGISRKQIEEEVCEFFHITKKGNKRATELVSLICGLKATPWKIYGEAVVGEENKKVSIGFRESNYEELESEIRECIGDDAFVLLQAAKEVHDIGLLSSIMKGQEYLSAARVEEYESHKQDLRLLKSVIKRYNADAYDEMFRIMKEGNYSAYVGSVNSFREKKRRCGGKGRSLDDFYKTVKALLKEMPQEDANIQLIMEKINSESFLKKQLTYENGVIPNQIHGRELKAILNRTEKYLPFLLEKDESGLTVSQRIEALFAFRIPYYVGPIGQNHVGEEGYHVWAKRREGEEKGRVYPWNFEQKIDMKEAAEAFIQRMVRHCTYLSGETVLPKNSLLYEKFTVLNELNNLRIDGEKPDIQKKQDIYHDLFEKGKRVTLNGLKSYLYNRGMIASKENVVITGIDNGFNNSLSSVGKFRGIFGDDMFADDHQKMIEEIIFWGTVYGDDKKFLRERIKEKYGHVLTAEQIKRITGFQFNGWGNLSKAFLELEGSCESGDCSIIQAMWNTNHNLMELLSDQYSYGAALQKMTGEAYKPLAEWTIDDLEDKYLSAPVKRMIWQTIRMLREVVEVTGREPDKIFVEMPREEGEKGKRTVSRKRKLEELYKSIQKERKDWTKEMLGDIQSKDEADFRSKKLYLYYLQQGRCMYSGEEISLYDLMTQNSLYDIDHIYPRHFIKDDSLENNLVLVKKEINSHKTDTYPLEPDIQAKRKNDWKMLRDRGFITEEKYNRLTRRDGFTDEEKAAFISRQLVETRQGTKSITQILQQAFPKSTVVFVKAGLISDFRQKYGLYKVRELNDTHHAKDAYLNVVVGNTYYTKFTSRPLNFIREGKQRPNENEFRYHMDKIFDYDVVRGNEYAWIAKNDESISTVKRIMGRNTVLVSYKPEEAHGALFQKMTIWGKSEAKPESYLPVKSTDAKGADVTKYGGFTAIANSGYTLVEYKVKGKTVRSLEAIPMYLGRAKNLTVEAVEAYVTDALQREYQKAQVSDVSIRRLFIPPNSKVKVDGFYYRLGGKSSGRIYMKNAISMYLSGREEEYLRKLLKAKATGFYEERDAGGEQILTAEGNMDLYRTFIQKLQSRPYSNNRWNICKILQEREDKFRELSLSGQCFILQQILSWITSAAQAIDLEMIGGKKHMGIEAINKKISETNEFVLIHQSVTGIYETKTNLLTV